MSTEYVRFLLRVDNVIYVSKDALKLRNRLTREHPVIGGESLSGYARRLADLVESDSNKAAGREWIFSSKISKPGFWDTDGNLIVSAADLDAGIWSYNYGNWEQRVLLVLDPNKAEEEEAA